MRSRGTCFRESSVRDHCYSVYIIASKSRVIYIGMTNDLSRRVFEHKNGLMEGFTKQYRCHRLVYYESFDDVSEGNRPREATQALEPSEEGLVDRTPKSHLGGLAAEWFTRHMYQPEKQVPPLAS